MTIICQHRFIDRNEYTTPMQDFHCRGGCVCGVGQGDIYGKSLYSAQFSMNLKLLSKTKYIKSKKQKKTVLAYPYMRNETHTTHHG